jgi:type IV pilus assembly protein PilN
VIKINLLPQKRRVERRAETSQLWLAVVLMLFLAEVVALFVFHGYKETQLQERQRVNRELQSQIDQAKKAVANHGEVKQKLEQLRAKEDAIAKLQSARTGPTAVLLELARIMTPGRGPTVDPERLNQLRRENPLAVFNPNWDARRLWLTEFVEQRRKVRLKGLARDGEDVSELARRLQLSSLFHDVRLMPAKKEKDKKTGLELVTFELEAQVRY